MKVLAINGSTRVDGNTAYGIKIMERELLKENIEVEVFNLGSKAIHQCIDCKRCFREKDGKCVFNDDIVNELYQKFLECDGLIIGSPIHFAGMAGGLKAALDRLFYINIAMDNPLRHKVGCSFGAVRRAGGIPANNQMNQYLQYAEMILPSSNYWNVIYGHAKGEAKEDEEGVRVLKNLSQNMAWTLNLIKNGRENQIHEPSEIKSNLTSMIR